MTDAITKGDFTSYELVLLGREGDSFHVSRSDFSISNFIVKRVSNDVNSGVFIFPLYFQEKVLTLSKDNFNY